MRICAHRPQGPASDPAATKSDPTLALLEGVHPLKHALRFEAQILQVVSPNPREALAELLEVAPDVGNLLKLPIQAIPSEAFSRLVSGFGRCNVVAVARRPTTDAPALMARPDRRPFVFLENPRDLGNIGAAVRVAAAAGAGGVLVSGPSDPWSPRAIRGSAGLHFAIPVAHVDHLDTCSRTLVAMDPAGLPFSADQVTGPTILAFGTEREGLSDDLRDRADVCLALPMTAGVSSLNLATSVSAVLYAIRLR